MIETTGAGSAESGVSAGENSTEAIVTPFTETSLRENSERKGIHQDMKKMEAHECTHSLSAKPLALSSLFYSLSGLIWRHI